MQSHSNASSNTHLYSSNSAIEVFFVLFIYDEYESNCLVCVSYFEVSLMKLLKLQPTRISQPSQLPTSSLNTYTHMHSIAGSEMRDQTSETGSGSSQVIMLFYLIHSQSLLLTATPSLTLMQDAFMNYISHDALSLSVRVISRFCRLILFSISQQK